MLLRSRSLWLSLVLLSTIFVATLCNPIDDGERGISARDDDDSDEDDCSSYGLRCPGDDPQLSKGAIIGIVIAILFVFFGIPILLCFFCAWCCFRRRKKNKFGTPIVAAPIVPQYVPQQYQYGGQPRDFTTNSQQPSSNNEISMAPFAPPQTIVNDDNVANIYSPQNGDTVKFNNMRVDDIDTSEVYERPPPYYEVVSYTPDELPPTK